MKYRPSYPKEAIDYLYNTIGFRTNSDVADIGAGTGIFSKLLLERGSHVIGVEPNKAMREVAEKLQNEYDNFHVTAGSAEATGLMNESVDFVTCAQAFHWFDRDLTKVEFGRILRPGGKVVLIWNSRLTVGTPFLELYEKLLHTFGIDYVSVNHRNVSHEGLRSFFEQDGPQIVRFTNRQRFDFQELQGRLFSSSYCPTPGHPNYEPMMKELRSIFDQTQEHGCISMEYETEIFWGIVHHFRS